MRMYEMIREEYIEEGEKTAWDKPGKGQLFRGQWRWTKPAGKKDKACLGGAPGRRPSASQSSRVWAGGCTANWEVEEDQGQQVTRGADTKKVPGGFSNKLCWRQGWGAVRGGGWGALPWVGD